MNREIAETLKNLGHRKILVVGDVMLDHFMWGRVSRISPEAPTPVVSYTGETFQAGGAGFTARVLAQLGAKVDLLAVTGDDHWSSVLSKCLKDREINPLFIVDEARPTTRKQRVSAKDPHLPSGSQQLIRLDYETTDDIGDSVEKEVLDYISKNLKNYDAVIASDYGKGVLTNKVMEALVTVSDGKVPMIGDPKGTDIGKYQGFTALKPNRFEAESITGIKFNSKEDIIKAGKKIVEQAALDYVIISLDTDGIFYCNSEGDHLFVPTQKMEVYDVAGAGDSVISIMALLAGAEIPPSHMLVTANLAAAVMITQKQPKTISIDMIINRLISNGRASEKLKTVEDIAEIINSASKRDSKVYFTNGYFDNISTAQVKFLEQLGNFKGIHIVALNSDKSIINNGHKPQLKQEDRVRLLQMFDWVDYIIVFDEEKTDRLLDALKPDVFLKGANYKGQKIVEEDTLKKIGCEVKFVSID